MIVVLKPRVSEEQLTAVTSKAAAFGVEVNVSQGEQRTVVGLIGNLDKVNADVLRSLPGVENVIRISKPYKIIARESHAADTVVNIGGVPVGGEQLQVIAGPCSVETPAQMEAAAAGVAAAGCRMMRGGAFKPRTSPYAFQGKGVEGLDMLQQAAKPQQLPVVTELMDARMLDTFLEHNVDAIQIGTRNMQNFDLLKEVGKVQTPVVLKRGMAATISEWLMSAEYIAAGGNHNIIFCERGVRSFERAYRNMLDVTAIPVIKKETHLPVIVDPSHAGGKSWLVPMLSKAAIAAGADGLLVEMHPTPCEAWCDADQALSPEQLRDLMNELGPLARAVNRTL